MKCKVQFDDPGFIPFTVYGHGKRLDAMQCKAVLGCLWVGLIPFQIAASDLTWPKNFRMSRKHWTGLKNPAFSQPVMEENEYSSFGNEQLVFLFRYKHCSNLDGPPFLLPLAHYLLSHTFWEKPHSFETLSSPLSFIYSNCLNCRNATKMCKIMYV